jgi:hypothetical protein
LVLRAQSPENLRFAGAVEHRHSVFPLEFADILDEARALVQQIEQPLVNFVNLSAPLPNLWGHAPSPLKFSSNHRSKIKSRDFVSRGFRSFAGLGFLGFSNPSTQASVGRHSKVVAVSVSEAKSISVHE